MKRHIWSLPLVGALMLGGCDMDLTDPNNPNEQAAISTRASIRQVAIGLQATYSNQLVDPTYTVGLVTDELGAGSATFDSYQRADAGEELSGVDGPATGTWSGMYSVIRVADVVIDNAELVGFGPGYTAGLLALGKFYKGLAFGQLYQIYPSAPIDVGPNIPHPEFVDRDQVGALARSLLQEAWEHVTAEAVPEEFVSQVLAPGFDLENSIAAMAARFALMAEDYDSAFAAAQNVDLGVFSEFRFAALDVNPLWNLWYNSGNAYQMRAREEFRTDAEAGDQRVDYWVEAADIVGAVRPQLDDVVRYMASTASYPVYLPDEMRLIMAEVYARDGNLVAARDELNDVRTPCSSPLPEPVACLPAVDATDLPTQADVLDAILEERRYELYLQAVRWSDLRRFGEPVAYQFMPIPTTECDRNNNAPSGSGLCPVD